jgi:hypothetical protein
MTEKTESTEIPKESSLQTEEKKSEVPELKISEDLSMFKKRGSSESRTSSSPVPIRALESESTTD